ncbi:heterokaryon incompatibility protein-domain-containing protein, partial [Lineolata rhizophorae]
MSLCGDCRELKFELTTPAKRTWRSKLLYWKATEASGFVRPDRTRLASFEVLEQNSAGGCVFCNIIMWIVRSDPDVHSLIKRTLRDSNDYVKLNIENLAGLDSVDGEHSSEKTYRTGNLLVSTRTTERNLKYAVNRQDQFKSGLATWQTSTNVTFDHSLPVVRQWINGCDSSHPGCPQDSQPLPKRLVHVAFSSGQIVLKLVQQDGLQEAKMGRYAALSHCWGNPEGVLRTLSDNIHIHLESIPFDDLSKTFKDAVRITKELGLCYLWIDSLCIVQDDLHDWQEESAKMPEIYQNAYVTIAATASPGSHRGCLFPRDPANRTNSLDKSPLHQRGWVVQETVLSQRIIHFAEDQLFWSCRSGTKSEDGTYNEPSAAIPADLSFPLAAHISWWTWVENYSARGLTMQSDKLPAMAGLTKLVERERGWQAAVGLWMNDLHYGLLWRTEGAARRICPDTDNVYIPSWSWASIKGPVK